MIGSIAWRRLSSLRSSSVSRLIYPGVCSLSGVHAPVAQVGAQNLGLDAHALHEDGALLDLLVHGVAVIHFTRKAPGSNDQIALERHGEAHLHTELVRVTTLTVNDALHLRRVPAVDLGAVDHRFAAGRLRDQPFGFV